MQTTYTDQIGPVIFAKWLNDVDRTTYGAASLAAFRSTPNPDGLIMRFVAGIGLYYYDASDHSSADNGYSIIVTSAGGRWKLLSNSTATTVESFGAVGDGTTDDTAAIQSAITYLAPTGGRLYFTHSQYKVTTTLNWINNANAGKPGIYFIGLGGSGGPNGGPGTSILSYIASGPLINVQGTKTFASGGTGSYFINGGGFQDIFFDGTHATGTSQAVYHDGWQYGEMRNCTFMNFPGDGVTQYIDPGYSTADFSSSTLDFTNCWFWNNGGTGLNQTGFVGAFSYRLRKCLFGYNAIGVTIVGSGFSAEDCSFVGSGFTQVGGVLSGGIHLNFGTNLGNTNRGNVTRCEFDYARTSHVSIDNFQTLQITQSRFIFRDRQNTGAMTPGTAGCNLAPLGPSSVIQGLRIKDCNVRVDVNAQIAVTGAANNGSGLVRITAPGHGYTTGAVVAVQSIGGTTEANGIWTVTVIDSSHFDLQSSTFTHAYTSGGTTFLSLTVNAFYLQNTSNVTDISVEGTVVSDNSNGGFTITKYQGQWTSSHANLRFGYNVNDLGETLIPGKPAPFYVGTCTTGPTIGTGAFSTIVFDTQDVVCAQIYPAGTTFSDSTLYNNTTGVFQAARAALFDIEAHISVQSPTSADTLRLQLVTTGGTYSRDFACLVTSSGIFSVHVVFSNVFLASGDTFVLQARSPANARALATTGGYQPRLSAKMVVSGR